MLTPHSHSKLDILVVDDDPFVRETIQIFLESEGMKVRTADCGEDGIAQLHQAEPDVALVDLRMPRMNGLEVLRAFKDYAPEVEVVMATGDATLESALSAMRSGAYTYIEKPIVDLEKDLLGVLLRAAERRQLRRTNRRLQGDLQLALHQLDAERRERRIGSEGFPIGRLLRRCASASPAELKAMILSSIPDRDPAVLYLRSELLLVPCAAKGIDLPPVDAVLPTHRFSDPGELWREGQFPGVFQDQDEALILPLFWTGELVGLLVLPVSDQTSSIDPGHRLIRRIADTAAAILGPIGIRTSTPTG
ncbi:MAG: response regulator [Planctomycetota bacterium]|nr:response regulator [Planctomycetota bacterium]